MKPILLSLLLLFSAVALSSCRQAASLPVDPDIVQQQQRRVIELESQLDGLRNTNNRWQSVWARAIRSSSMPARISTAAVSPSG